MKERHKEARRSKYARLHTLEADDSPVAIPEEDEEIEGLLTASDLDSLHFSDSSRDEMTADTLIGDPREERPFLADDADEALRVPSHHWIHRKPRPPGLRSRHPHRS